MHVGRNSFKEWRMWNPEKIQFSEKWKNRKFGKNPKFF